MDTPRFTTFHLCRLMVFNTIFLLLRNQIAFELLLFIGMVGGFHSLMTPELTHGSNLFVNRLFLGSWWLSCCSALLYFCAWHET